jgi:serine protease Do
MKDITKIVDKVCPAVITIIASKDLPKIEGFYSSPLNDNNFAIPKFGDGGKEKTKIGGGSGVIVSSDGYIITSNHVVADEEACYSVVVEPTQRYETQIMSRDPINDIAILKIQDKVGCLPYLPLGDSDNIKLGEWVIAVGNPLGEFHDTVSAGIISGLSRFITAYNSMAKETARLKGLIQTDAAINPGNSGGPLINMKGEIIGINTAVVAGSQNLGFAIPINYAKRDLEEVQKYGKVKRPFLGIRYITLSKEMSEQNRLPVSQGALIIRERLGEEAIISKSAADKAGLKEFDIITAVNNEEVTEKNPLANMIQKFNLGDIVALRVIRGEEEMVLKIELEEKN